MGQTPFIRILFPVLSGIVFCKFICPNSSTLFYIGLFGLAIILSSFFIVKKRAFGLRWLFGLGLMIFLFSISATYYQYRLTKASYNFPEKSSSYIGEVLNTPQEKARSVACEFQLTYPVHKKIMLYLEPNSNSLMLEPGDELLAYLSVKPFKNLGNPDDFDYEEHMQNRGFSGSAYVNELNWHTTNRRSPSIRSTALRIRTLILNQYKKLNLDDDAYSFIAAITLGYKDDLSDDLKEAFRASGTSHILAVSGLHVGIIFLIISYLFSFIGNNGKARILRQFLILLCLWGYVFITGMPVSVVRAAIMLSLVCIGSILNKQGLTYNTLAVTAFIILVINPFYLFDVGFQLSFAAVLAILFFQPKLSKLYQPKSKIVGYVWNLFTVSLAAQLGVFPLVLHYFGTFPTYFFITNILVLPLVALIIYTVATLLILSLLSSFLNIVFLTSLYKIGIGFIQLLIKAVLEIVYFIESLPMAEITGVHISVLQVILLFGLIVSFSYYLLERQVRSLILALTSWALLFSSYSASLYKKPDNQFYVYNSYNGPDIGYKLGGERISLATDSNMVISHPKADIILLVENNFKSNSNQPTIPLDYLIIAYDNSFSITELLSFFEVEKIIIDASINRYSAQRIIKECDNLNVPYHDISNSGAFLVNF